MSLVKDQIKIHFSEPEYKSYFSDDDEPRNVYKITVTYNSHQCTFSFGDSIANTESGERSSDESILETITSDFFYTEENYPNYEDFAGEFGYELDSRKGEKVYKACLRQAEKLHKVFSNEDIEKIREELEL